MVTIIDYGMGNIWSVQSALRYINAEMVITDDPNKIVLADSLILPGVGSFRKAMEIIKNKRIDEAIIEAVVKKGVPILGICLGLQLLGSHGTEDGSTVGLQLTGNRVERFSKTELAGKKIPHVGFDTVKFDFSRGLYRNLPASADFYFVHSYRMKKENLNGNLGCCHYGCDFVAAFEHENICGVQFHPEKSQTNGLTLLKNFIKK